VLVELMASGFLSIWLGKADVQVLKTVNWVGWLNASLLQTISQPKSAPDPAAIAIVRQNLGDLAQLNMLPTQQGVWIQAGNEVVAENQGSIPLSAASLTKIATTLVSLETWGADHQFQTLVGATGPIENGVLQGDLVIQGGGDPFFVWEEAIALGNALNQKGIRRVTGNLIIAGDFAMNFQTDPLAAGRLLQQGINASLWNAEAATQYQTLPPGTPKPQVIIAGSVQSASVADAQNRVKTSLIHHQSLPLSEILKALNTYSNNVMAEMLATQLGGAQIVAQKAAEIINLPPTEIQLINGSGLGMENRISPRAICAMLVNIQRYLSDRQMNVADVFPVVGLDQGTSRHRQIPRGAAVKTGTLNEVSSLAGVIPTRDRGLVWFSIINVGNAELSALHNQQDLLLQRLQQHWGVPTAIPVELTPADRATQAGSLLGAPSRNGG
jgi:D-alanyl-D-alanine carboxypeptidase/D-alanyl-D-alanine-endopeptidase (penicillin-binding protein 4)